MRTENRTSVLLWLGTARCEKVARYTIAIHVVLKHNFQQRALFGERIAKTRRTQKIEFSGRTSSHLANRIKTPGEQKHTQCHSNAAKKEHKLLPPPVSVY